MSGTPGENDWFEKDGKMGQDPRGPTGIAGDTPDKNKGQEGADNEMEESKEENKDENKEEKDESKEDNEEPIERKRVWICGICKTMAKRGAVKCMGCSKWIHRRYSKYKQNCSGLKREDDYILGKYRCPNCSKPEAKRKGPGRPVKPKYAVKVINTQRRQKRNTSAIPVTKIGKRKTREDEGPSEKSKSIDKKEGEDSTDKSPTKSPSKKKPKADGGKSEDISNKAKNVNVNEKCLISCGGANLNQADIESLEDKGLVTDEIILFFMQAILEYMKSQIGILDTKAA